MVGGTYYMVPTCTAARLFFRASSRTLDASVPVYTPKGSRVEHTSSFLFEQYAINSLFGRAGAELGKCTLKRVMR